MLKWKLGAHDYDGVWGKYWYNDVNNSTGFTKLTKKKRNIPATQKKWASTQYT